MSPEAIVGLILGGFAILGVTWRVFSWLYRVNQIVEAELTPNSGTSMKDMVAKNTLTLVRLESKLDTYMDGHAELHRRMSRDD